MSTYNDYDDQSLEIEGDFLPLKKYSLRAIFTGTPCKKCHSFFVLLVFIRTTMYVKPGQPVSLVRCAAPQQKSTSKC